MKLWVNVCFYHVENRLQDFYEVIKNLSDISDINLIINSNINFDTNLPIHVSNLDNPKLHVWEHKKYMPMFLESDYTHFAYLEGNIQVKKETFEYWLKTRELFKRNNLNFLPAIHRVQESNGEFYTLDCLRKQINQPTITVEDKKFISLSEPYQGMFIMDKELVEEHMKSEYFTVGLKKSFGIRESANLGNMFINVPQGFSHRYMTPLDNFQETLVKHFGTNYHADKSSPHGKIKIKDLFG